MWYQRQANKYGSKKTVYNQRKYDSKLEAGVAQEIDILVRAGEVKKVEPQKTFPLYGKNGGRICNHRVDFLLEFKDGRQEVWEAKGFATEIWRLKRTLFEDNYPEIRYVVVTAKNPNWYVRKAINK
jgi:hypothetical protein